MIGFWRKRSKNFIVYFMFFAIVVVFIFWGTGRFGNSVGGAAAIVNDHAITVQEYRNALQRMIEFYSQMMQGNFDEEAQKQYRIKETALNQLINKELIAEHAQAMGLQVTDNEIRSNITELPVLQKDGHFSREYYDMLLKNYRMSPGQFEAGLRKDALLEKSRRLFENSIRPSEMELEKEMALKSTRLNIEYLRLDNTVLSNNVEVSEKEVKDFLADQSHKQKVKEYFDLHKSEFSKEAQVRARHILIKAQKGDKKAEDAAKQKAAKIQDELKSQDFAGLAKKYSDDPGSKEKGGDLGWFSHGRMVPEFEKAVFDLSEGQVSGPVQSSFGFHIIKVEGKQPAQSTPLEAAQNQIAKKIISGNKSMVLMGEIEKKISQDPKDAVKQVITMAKDLKWEETGSFSLNDEQIPKIGESSELMAEVSALKGDGAYLPHLFKLGNYSYLVKTKKATDAVAVDVRKNTTDASKEFYRNIYYAWSSKLRDSAKIKINPQLFADPDSAPVDYGDSGY